ncbi:MAG: 7-carboxy-7-deazaguanine synthase QueE [Thermoguttaceae bacterium]|nr:7-carboxy-7-deazaguanine synthase QueE [Thermoguttaceae bacterium]
MRIVEIFLSRQGEGLSTGVESTFIRVGGCNLRCSFCDTPYASWENEEGEDLSVEEIVGRAILFGCRHVVLTGGEPMLYSEMIPLTRQLRQRHLIVTIETAGTLEIPVECDLMSISPKLSNSIPQEASGPILRLHESNRYRPEVVRHLVDHYEYQLKFVVDEPEDLLEVDEYLVHLGAVAADRVLLMPMAIDLATMREKAEWIVAYARKKGYRYCPRMQIEWYGNKRRT